MPESRARAKKKAVYTPPPAKKEAQPSPRWWAPLMVGLMVVGLAYVVWTYLNGGPLPRLGSWNLAIGLGAILVGFGMTMRWR
jgi:uncharacterized RDD family membrane protein YckC